MVLTCYCQGYCDDESTQEGTCTVNDSGKCFSQIEVYRENGVLKELRTWGCFGFLTALFQCYSLSSLDGLHKNITCCKDSDLCNLNLLPKLPPYKRSPDPVVHNQLFLSVLLPSLVVLGFTCILGYCFFKKKIKRFCKALSQKIWRDSASQEPETSSPSLSGSASDSCSGSGAGFATLRQVTVALEIKLKGAIGKGRFGEVLLGERKGELVAVKLFSAQDEASWIREKEIYEEIRISHNKNILGFKATDIMWLKNETKMLVVTEYHELGSLYEYLKNYAVNMQTMFRMGYSVISGLFYLHEDIAGDARKPAIAHRDLKSKNILVKNTSGECCIADFGLAVKCTRDCPLDIGSNPRVGTKRYMAPEVLEKNIDLNWIDSFKRADIYSFSLVLWEICVCFDFCRKDTGMETGEHKLPYFDVVPIDPSFEEMIEVVCVRKLRPRIPECWRESQVMGEITRILEECWRAEPTARLTALRIKKDFIELNRKSEKLKLKLD